MSIAPAQNIPLTRTINRLLADIEVQVTACRRAWWAGKQTACLENKWAVVRSSGGVTIAQASSFEAKQIADAVYDPEQDVLHISFHNSRAVSEATPQ